ncbi:hypothetical protein PpBr36_02328 [Pyricularia pennisetigena]|uniref:hypothetical protein n=1 Tax=Pyricularia pennisetigena TaxID=1578925 RepID=UPI00114FCC03|nr:hypothetical protein PpBr36_02328 [Pyricularia pennisetigena]TLS30417.1 hypothetical protein PpBr36_02328 [Pyricularia pennisetigena]
MRFSSCLAAATALTAGVSAAPAASAANDLEAARAEVNKMVADITAKKMAELQARAVEAKQKGRCKSTCTADNVIVRKEYGDLTKEERADYVRAVKCLMELPARTPRSVAPGARSRFDDFTVTHIQQTLKIHYTGNFQPWHRWFLFTYEKTLRDECGYKGYHPYWDWAKYATAPQDSPIFNGDQYSLGGNGEWIGTHEGPMVGVPEAGATPLRLPPGVGGGVVKTGPFQNRTILLGPVGTIEGVPAGPNNGLGENPRSWKRDVGPGVNMRFANYTTVLNLLTAPDIDSFRNVSEGGKGTSEIGPHGGGHYTIGGDPGGDVFTSPNDPAFYVHHGQMDRVWFLWQEQDRANRLHDLGKGLYAHQTWWNEPASNLTSPDEIIDLGYAGGKIAIKDVADTTSGPFCYIYQ